jgi:RimJ/RimL family protein N-acetyltransferase
LSTSLTSTDSRGDVARQEHIEANLEYTTRNLIDVTATRFPMFDAAKYSEVETLRNGRQVEIRALQPEDRDDFVAAAHSMSTKSLHRRFFAVRREFTEKETSFFVNVDFINHVALVVVFKENGQSAVVGGGRYVVVKPGQAEVAFAVVDQYQGQGIGTALMHHLGTIARAADIRELIADVLPENVAMLKVFESSGFQMNTERDFGIVRVTLRLSRP